VTTAVACTIPIHTIPAASSEGALPTAIPIASSHAIPVSTHPSAHTAPTLPGAAAPSDHDRPSACSALVPSSTRAGSMADHPAQSAATPARVAATTVHISAAVPVPASMPASTSPA
jgi:hypothetical protein